jgi:hypothetical protein
MSNITINVTFEDDDGCETTVAAPGTFEVCGRCSGHGKHCNPNIDGHGISMEEWNGPSWDDESREAYMSGAYDVTCHDCKGKRVIEVIDWEAFERDQPEAAKAHAESERDLADMYAIEAAERRMGC